ncbi:phosphinothricin acetyltransferase [Capnocytophaga sp. G1920]|uniref:phosphinothricin acetyltransferase n=1 Tax=Capnocytophaga sp. G1920 TaxID=3448875 RepID=UPI003EDC8267
MWRVIYWVSPRTPEGGQAGKADTPPLHIPSCRWLPPKGELGTKTYSFKGGM